MFPTLPTSEIGRKTMVPTVPYLCSCFTHHRCTVPTCFTRHGCKVPTYVVALIVVVATVPTCVVALLVMVARCPPLENRTHHGALVNAVQAHHRDMETHFGWLSWNKLWTGVMMCARCVRSPWTKYL